MGRNRKRTRRKRTLKTQVYDRLTPMFEKGKGQSRYEAKKTGADRELIFSENTYRTYMRECRRFLDWCVMAYPDMQLKSLNDCKPYMETYLQLPGYSAYTITTRAAAICKMYGMSIKDLSIKLPERRRADITRSRSDAVRDYGLSDETRRIYGAFCRCTGLRRRELKALKGSALIFDTDGTAYLHVTNGKGGKSRFVPVIGSDDEIDNVIRMCRDAGDSRVFASIPSHLDVHTYRAEYATRYYHMLARDKEDTPPKEKYYCRKDKAGVCYDRAAMVEVSKALGHNRVDVIAQHYLRY